MSVLPESKDPTLFTPGPLTTSRTVKQAMLRDVGSRDSAFIELVARVRQRLLAVAGTVAGVYEAVPMQGSGTFGVEAALAAATPRGGKLLVAVNGAYGERLLQIAALLDIATSVVRYDEDQPLHPEDIDATLRRDADITTVAVVHCETTTGMLNPIAAIGAAVRRHGKCYCVDAMSSFGAVPIDLAGGAIDYLMSSANKCLEGVPGIAVILARRAMLLQSAGNARSLSLDLLAQWRGLEGNGQFRFTPPTHVLLALDQALTELADEGGVPGRAARYAANHATLMRGMRALGFRAYLPAELQSAIITSFRYPDDPRFTFEAFYERLQRRGMVIYPGKVSRTDCFRIGTIGRIFESDVLALLGAIRETLAEMGVTP